MQVTGRRWVLSGMVSVLCAGVVAGCGAAGTDVASTGAASTGGVSSSVETTATQRSAAVEPSASRPADVVPPVLSPRAKELIDLAKQARRESVVLTISTVSGQAEATAQALRDLGATVESVDAAVGYVRASVPVAVAAQAATLDGVSRADVEEEIGFPDPTP